MEGQKLKTESHGNVLRPLVSQLLNSTSSQSAILYFASSSMDECELSALGNQAGVQLQTTANDNIHPKFFFLNDSVTDYSMSFILSEQDRLNLIKKVLDCRL